MGQKPTILIVDDRPSIVEVLCLFLRLRGYETQEAYDGETALELMRRHRPDLVLLDLVIPERSGFEVLRAMRSDEQLSHIPVIVMTARAEVGDSPSPGLEGAAAFVPKPFDLEEVAKLISQVLVNQPAAS